MAANTTPLYVKDIQAKGTTWTNSDSAATKKTIFTADATNGSRIDAIAACSDDSSPRVFSLYLNDGSGDFLVGSVSIASLAGTDGAVPADNLLSRVTMLPWVASDGSLLVPAGWVLKAANLTQITSAKTVTLVALAGHY